MNPIVQAIVAIDPDYQITDAQHRAVPHEPYRHHPGSFTAALVAGVGGARRHQPLLGDATH